MTLAARRMMFVVGGLVTSMLAFSALGPPPPTVHYTTPEGEGAFTVSTNWDWPMTPAWVVALVSVAAWAMVAGLFAIGNGKFAEARRWRNATLGFAMAGLVVGLTGGLSLMNLGLRDLEEIGVRTRGLDVARVVRRGALLQWWGVAGFGVGVLLAWILSAARSLALRRHITRSAEGTETA